MIRAARGERIGQFLLARVTGWVGRCYGGLPRVRLGKVGQGACCGLEELLVFLLLVCRCYPRSVMVFCAVLRSSRSLFARSLVRPTVYRHPI